MAVFEGSLFLRLAPEDFPKILHRAVGVERRIDVDEIDAAVRDRSIGQLGELFEVVTTIDDAGVEEGAGFAGFGGLWCRGLRGGFLPLGHVGKITREHQTASGCL